MNRHLAPQITTCFGVEHLRNSLLSGAISP
jgi:hypothetical protein